MGFNYSKKQIMISLIVPSYNNLRHLKNCYASIKKHAPQAEIVLLDDGSTDGTWDWIVEVFGKDSNVVHFRSESRVGHTVLYDEGIRLASNSIVGILHADMIVGSNYIENILKHLKPGTVVCATRIEPPLHNVTKDKILMDFGMDFDSLKIPEFESFCTEKQREFKGQTTSGMFAPWVLYKEDFINMGGHDRVFAPFPIEDSDIFERWLIAGYKLVQSRDAFVYHLTCRGHRWTEQVGKDDEFYKAANHRAIRNYLRKWGSWIKNDEFQHPILSPKYNIAFLVDNCGLHCLETLEPWADRIYVDEVFKTGRMWDYVEMEQENTLFDLSKRVLNRKEHDAYAENDIVVEFDASRFNKESFNLIQQLPDIIKESGEVGKFELDIFIITIARLEERQSELIKPLFKNIF